ncbi:MAG: putative membrane protein [Saprospiraceae bacterium]
MLGLVGSVGLLMRKKWTVPAFLVSLIAIIIQMGYSCFGTNALEVMEQSPIFPAMLVIFSVVLWWYSKRSDARGFLS